MQRFRSTMTAVTVVTLAAAGVASITPAEASTGRAGAFRSTSTLHTASPAKRAHPHHPPATRFTHGRVDNEWFPLRPGTRLVYRGNDEGVPATDIFIVTYKTKVVDGVVCRQVFDRVVKHGKVRERTVDWYAQTKRGTVWYFGERTATLDRNGQVKSRDGSFQSGRNGAEAGIFMPAHPRVGYAATQEFYPGHAQDHFRILSLKAPAVSPAGGDAPRHAEPGDDASRAGCRRSQEVRPRHRHGQREHGQWRARNLPVGVDPSHPEALKEPW